MIGLTLQTFGALAAWSFVVPINERPDAPSHWDWPACICQNGSLPVGMEFTELVQRPLYYVLISPVADSPNSLPAYGGRMIKTCAILLPHCSSIISIQIAPRSIFIGALLFVLIGVMVVELLLLFAKPPDWVMPDYNQYLSWGRAARASITAPT